MEGYSQAKKFMEMGFSMEKVNEAIVVMGDSATAEDVVSWLLEHPDTPKLSSCNLKVDVDKQTTEVVEKSSDADPDVPSGKDSESACDNDSEMPVEEPKPGCSYMESDDKPSQIVQSIRCEECGRHFRSEDIEYHAIKTNHQTFTESTEEIKPMTEEEKQEALKKVQDLIKQRRIVQAEKTKKEEIERERNRRRVGQEMTSARQKLAEAEMKSLAEQKRKEKCEALLARQHVLQQIERDKQERREKFGFGFATTAAVTPVPKVVEQAAPPPPPKDHKECRLQIRLTNGECLVHTFKANEELAAVRLYVELHRTDGCGPFVFKTTFPKRVFTEDDMACPLKALDLVPSAVLIVSKPS